MFYKTYTAAMSVPIPTRFSDDEVARIDALVEAGVGETRSEVVRRAVAQLADVERRRRIGEEIVQSYREMPETDGEMAWASANAVAMVEAEPWELKPDGLWGPCDESG